MKLHELSPPSRSRKVSRRVRPPVAVPKAITADPVVVSDLVMKAGRCRFNGAFPSADLSIFSEIKLPSSI
jgi:hypothetical protein